MKGSGLAPSPHLALHNGSVGIAGIHAVLTGGGTVQGSPRDSQVTKKLRKWQALGQSLEAVELEITGFHTRQDLAHGRPSAGWEGEESQI